MDKTKFVATDLPNMTVYDYEKRGVFELKDAAGNILELDLNIELGGALVASVQSLFISILSRQVAGRPLGRRHGWAEIASRVPRSVHADASEMEEGRVYLSVDEDTRFEVNYRLSPDQARALAGELLKACQSDMTDEGGPVH